MMGRLSPPTIRRHLHRLQVDLCCLPHPQSSAWRLWKLPQAGMGSTILCLLMRQVSSSRHFGLKNKTIKEGMTIPSHLQWNDNSLINDDFKGNNHSTASLLTKCDNGNSVIPFRPSLQRTKGILHVPVHRFHLLSCVEI